MSKVDIPINNNEATSVDFLPIRSPKWPNRTAPNGRARKASPKLRNDNISCADGDSAGKNKGPNSSAAAVA